MLIDKAGRRDRSRRVDGICSLWPLLLALLLWAPSGLVQAHVSGLTDTSIQVARPGIRLVFTTPIDNLLNLPYQIQGDDDGTTPTRYLPAVASGFELAVNDIPCQVIRQNSRYLETLKSAQFRLDYQCPQPIGNLRIRYGLLFNIDASHRNLVRLIMAGKRLAFTLDRSNPTMSIEVGHLLKQWGKRLAPFFLGEDPNRKPNKEAVGSQKGTVVTAPVPTRASLPVDVGTALFSSLNPTYLRLGIEHILSGYDHILFVVALLLIPASLSRLAGLVTAFTIAHSITLGLSVFDIVSLPPAITEPLIALSIIYVAVADWRLLSVQKAGAAWVENLRNRKSRRWVVTFGFGLIHGFGFSYILREMGLGQDRASALLLFNMGVEIGQMLIVLSLLPLLHFLVFRRSWGRAAIRVLALLIALLAGFWFFQRI